MRDKCECPYGTQRPASDNNAALGALTISMDRWNPIALDKIQDVVVYLSSTFAHEHHGLLAAL